MIGLRFAGAFFLGVDFFPGRVFALGVFFMAPC